MRRSLAALCGPQAGWHQTREHFAGLFDIRPFESISKNQVASVEVSVPLISGAATVGVQATEGTALSDTDPVTARATSPTATIGGSLVVSRQAWELGEASMLDIAIATELGRAWATALDQQLISGIGSTGETLGLLAVTSPTAAAYTDASPTAQELMTAISKLASVAATARGVMPSVCLMHTRRWAWLSSSFDSQNRPLTSPLLHDLDDEQLSPQGAFGSIPPGLNVYATPTVPTTLGTGTNEDRVIFLTPADLIAYVRPPQFICATESNGEFSTGQYRATAYGYCSSIPQRYPTGIGILSGTGLVSVSGW